ncbi:ABC transporter substrate-binding protein [Treponema sp. R6D11]
MIKSIPTSSPCSCWFVRFVVKFLIPSSCWFVFSLSLITSLTGCVKQKHGLTIADGTLSVGVEIGYPPMEYYDSDSITLIGFDIELTKAIADKLGLTVNYIDTSWDSIFAGLETNKYDIAVNITILPERLQRFNFTKPYIDSSIVIVTAKNSSVKITTPEDIKGYRAAYQGDTTAQYFAERLKKDGITFTSFSYDKITNCFDDLVLGRIDLIVADNIAAYYYTEKENSPFEIAWQGASGELIGICIKKGNDALTAAIDNALDELFKDGTIRKISLKIFNRDLVSQARNF